MKTFSKVSGLALQYALALARQHDARIYLTHIVSLIIVCAQTTKTFAAHMPRLRATSPVKAERPVLTVRAGSA